MYQPYIGEIRMIAGNYAPVGWEFCHGQLLPISENETLFVIIGTMYGGDGESTFALPDLRGRIPIHQGAGYQVAQTGGVESVTLSVNQIPSHTHPMLASADPNVTAGAQGNVLGANATATPFFPATPTVALSGQAMTPVGGSQPHENFQPYLCVNFIISMFGLFPTQT